MKVKFAKYQALGNSFIVLDEIVPQGKMKKYEILSRQMCDATHGVGADGILVVSKSRDTLRVDIYNADGSWAEKSGNGIRIAATHLLNNKTLKDRRIDIMTGSGISTIEFHSGNDSKRVVSASLGKPEFETKLIPVQSDLRFFINQPLRLERRKLIVSAVSVGNPHLILFCDDFDFDWQSVGAMLEPHELFPNRINVGFVKVESVSEISVRDYERGVGPTESSGTGAAAAVVISVMRGFTNRLVDVKTQAGILSVHWDDISDEVFIKGPVEFICSGNFETT